MNDKEKYTHRYICQVERGQGGVFDSFGDDSIRAALRRIRESKTQSGTITATTAAGLKQIAKYESKRGLRSWCLVVSGCDIVGIDEDDY